VLIHPLPPWLDANPQQQKFVTTHAVAPLRLAVSATWHVVSLLLPLAGNRAPGARNKASNPELRLVRKYQVFVWLRLEAASDRKHV
jgi:hypothetical protein